ncbi:POU domain, class 3, transcription factor 3-like [Pollicipes pollicipes]|uniref:POU domain, class 3, transcription factor 3-like n=1 Tax=Pollicipes pollicipes TaxID=41117 RepID=UPI001884CBD8|nr:POU domain, class 3, transcription factor 3-like [Pollicipes pollicipes]
MLTFSAAGQLEYVVMVAVLMVILMIATCVCWKQKHPSAENLGLPGRIKVTSHDGTTSNGTGTQSKSSNNMRLSALHRELPQIPTSAEAAAAAAARRSSGAPSEHASELYAVVSDPEARPAPPPAAIGAAALQEGERATAAADEKDEEADTYYEQPDLARSRSERHGGPPPPSTDAGHSRNPSAGSGDIPRGWR